MAGDAAPWRSGKTDTPPKRAAPKPAKAKKPLMPVADIRPKLKGTFAKIGLLVYAKDQVDGTVILGASPGLVDAYCDLAEHNVYVHRALSSFAAVDDSLGVLGATAVMVLPILKNHGMYAGPLLVSLRDLEEEALNQHPDLGDEVDSDDDSDLDEPIPGT